MNLYIVHMINNDGCGQYVLGAWTSGQVAIKMANAEVEYKQGRYKGQVLKAVPDSEEEPEIFYNSVKPH